MMVQYTGSDCKVYYKLEDDSDTYGSYDITISGAREFFEIPFIDNITLNWEPDRPGVIPVSKRTRRVDDTAILPVLKKDYKVTIDGDFEASETNSLCSFVTHVTAPSNGFAKYVDIANHPERASAVGVRKPQQFSLIIMVDADRDGLFSDGTEASHKYIVVKGCFINSLTISGSEGEYIKYSLELSVQKIDHTNYAATDGSADVFASIYNDIASPQLCAFYNANFNKEASLTHDDNVAEISAFSVTINNNYTKTWGLNDGDAATDGALPYVVTPGKLEITGSFTKAFIDMIEFAEINDSEVTGSIVIVITPLTGAAQTITLSTVNYDSLGMPIGAEELINQEIAFTASSVVLS